MTIRIAKDKIIEIAFLTVFSLFIIVLFFNLMSMNGLVLGNDPAVHLEKAQMFLQTGKIPLITIGWTPPLYQILLVAFITFTGASSFEQLIFSVKIVAVLIDWLLFFIVYLIGARFFNKKVGAVAAVLLLACFPMYEVNMWGGYTSVLGVAFMFLLFLYLPLAVEDFGYLVVTFILAFSLVLSHQLTTFVSVIILAPVIVFMLIKSRGASLKALLALIVGGGIAFFLYYFQAMFGYLGGVIEHVFFAQKAMAYQIPATTLTAFLQNFGFVFVIAIAGLFVAFYMLWVKKKPVLNLILMLSFIVPFVLAESYVFGLYLPFQWFIYYLLPPMAILAAVTATFAASKFLKFYYAHRKTWKQLWLKTLVISAVILVSLVLVFRVNTVYGKVNEAGVYYSTSDIKAYEAGAWLKTNYPNQATVVVTEVPGFWFSIFSGKTVIADTNPIVERNVITSSVLDLAHEIESPLTLLRICEAKGDVSDENYVSINNVWNRVFYSSGDGDFLSYQINGLDKKVELSQMIREVTLQENQSSQKQLDLNYLNDEVALTQSLTIRNDTYPTNIVWALTPLKSEVANVTLYVSTFFDLHYSFEKAYIAGILNWESPWSKPSSTHGNDWAVVDFSHMTDNYIGLYDVKNQIYYGMKFNDLPSWGNIGVLTSNQIDAIRFQYHFDKINVNQTEFIAYQTLAFSENSYPSITQPDQVKNLFGSTPSGTFDIQSRDYNDYIKANNIQFIVYDKNQLDTKIINCKLLELIYSNDRYAIFKIKNV